MPERCLIIGAGLAGARTALLLRQYGYDGAIVLAGEEAHAPYDRPPLSKAHLQQRGLAPAFLASPAVYAENRIDLVLGGRIERLDLERGEAIVAGACIAFDRLVFATGAAPRALGIPGEHLPGVMGLRTIEDAAAIADALTPGAKVVIIGGGFIGLEVAAAASTHDCVVTLIEAGGRLMGRSVSAPVASLAAQSHRRRGVDLMLRCAPTRFFGRERLEAVTLSNGRRLNADVAIVGVGVRPRDELARAAGLDCDDGILVDAQGRTSRTRVHAVGDVTRLRGGVRRESWHSANRQADAVARDIAGLPAAAAEAPWVWSDQGEDQIQLVGDMGERAEAVERFDEAANACTRFYLRDGVLLGAETFNSSADAAFARRMAGRRLEAVAGALSDTSIPLRKAFVPNGDKILKGTLA